MAGVTCRWFRPTWLSAVATSASYYSILARPPILRTLISPAKNRVFFTMLIRLMRFRASFLTLCFSMLAATPGKSAAPVPQLELDQGDHICTIGNTLADRMQHYPWLETYIHALHPQHELTFRNLGFSGDEVAQRPRADNFGDADQWLTKWRSGRGVLFFRLQRGAAR